MINRTVVTGNLECQLKLYFLSVGRQIAVS